MRCLVRGRPGDHADQLWLDGDELAVGLATVAVGDDDPGAEGAALHRRDGAAARIRVERARRNGQHRRDTEEAVRPQ